MYYCMYYVYCLICCTEFFKKHSEWGRFTKKYHRYPCLVFTIYLAFLLVRIFPHNYDLLLPVNYLGPIVDIIIEVIT